MKLSEIRQLADQELVNKIADARQESMNLRFQVISGQLSDTSRLKVIRRQIAQFETVLRERELAQEGKK
jgi:large subunit ribosomal protein L29